MTNKESVKKYQEKMKKDPIWVQRRRQIDKKSREKGRFGRSRISILKYFNFTCQKCLNNFQDNTSKLHVHHINCNGRNTDYPDNEIANLTVICASCHAKITWKSRHKYLRENHIFPNHWKKFSKVKPIRK